MALRTNHYDLAFEEYLRSLRTAYVVVDEKRRSLLQEVSLKSMDFIVTSGQGQNLLVDVKGRKFPSGGEQQSHRWENWATADDIECLLQWQTVFGAGFRSVLVFAYDIVDIALVREFDRLFSYKDHTYAFYGVWVDEYHEQMRQRSPSWQTVNLSSSVFRKLRMPIEDFL